MFALPQMAGLFSPHLSHGVPQWVWYLRWELWDEAPQHSLSGTRSPLQTTLGPGAVHRGLPEHARDEGGKTGVKRFLLTWLGGAAVEAAITARLMYHSWRGARRLAPRSLSTNHLDG